MRGPLSPSINDEAGLLVEGFGTLVPLAVLLSLATVYGQFHYAVDALAGAAVAACVLGLGRAAGYNSGLE